MDQFSFSASPLMFVIIAGTLTMFLGGLLDDFKHFQPATKLFFQLIATSIVIISGKIVPLANIRIMDILVIYGWFLTVINAVNMLDNMDGLCAGIAIIVSLTISFMLGIKHNLSDDIRLVVYLNGVLIAALAGFLIHNWPPASIFMGDCGSMFVGFVLATFTVPSSLNQSFGLEKFALGDHFLRAFLIPVMLLAVPIFDTVFVVITRLGRAQKPFQGGQDHLSHRLAALGFSKRKVIVFFYLFASLGTGIAFLVNRLFQ